MRLSIRFLAVLGVALLSVSNWVSAGPWKQSYEVTITNVTKGVYFTPLLNVAHSPRVQLFEVGEAASAGLGEVAEGGAVDTLISELSSADATANVAVSEGLLGPGSSVTVTVEANPYQIFSLASMLLPTNDTFVALNGVRFPRYGSRTYLAKAYDGGTETNDEICANIPGPQCGGSPFSPEDEGEGYIFPAPGIHGEADLSVATYNWQGAVAKVTIKRVR